MSWDEAQGDFRLYIGPAIVDGEFDYIAPFWEIHIPYASDGDWENFFRFVVSTYPCEYKAPNRKGSSPPATAEEMFAHLKQRVGLIQFHFLVDEIKMICILEAAEELGEIQLIFDAISTTEQRGFNSLVGFMNAVGRLLRKEMTLSLEDDHPVLVYTPEADEVRWTGARPRPA